jgi:hypothetical protein
VPLEAAGQKGDGKKGTKEAAAAAGGVGGSSSNAGPSGSLGGAGSAGATAAGGKQKGGGKGDVDVVMTDADGAEGGAGPSGTTAAAAAAEAAAGVASGSNSGGKGAKSYPESEEEVVKGIQESVLLPWLSFMLSESLSQLVERWRVYLLVLRVVQQLCRPSTEALLVGIPAAAVRAAPWAGLH